MSTENTALPVRTFIRSETADHTFSPTYEQNGKETLWQPDVPCFKPTLREPRIMMVQEAQKIGFDVWFAEYPSNRSINGNVFGYLQVYVHGRSEVDRRFLNRVNTEGEFKALTFAYSGKLTDDIVAAYIPDEGERRWLMAFSYDNAALTHEEVAARGPSDALSMSKTLALAQRFRELSREYLFVDDMTFSPAAIRLRVHTAVTSVFLKNSDEWKRDTSIH